MGYRIPDMPPMRPKVHDAVTPVHIDVDNGTISRVEFPCAYATLERYDRDVCDHRGWPSPDHPDRSGQQPHRFGHAMVYDPIDLELEGYDEIVVSTTDQPDGVQLSGSISGSVVTLVVDAMCAEAIDEDVSFQFAVYATGEATGYGDDPIPMRDVVVKGTIRIVAGPISTD